MPMGNKKIFKKKKGRKFGGICLLYIKIMLACQVAVIVAVQVSVFVSLVMHMTSVGQY